MLKTLLACRFFLVLLLPASLALIQTPALAQEPIARVSSFVGEVFVRSAVTPPAGEWRRLTAAPANLFNGDEVRTERGRAEVLYPNDDAVRILENSTARVSLSQESRGRFIFRRLVNLRAVTTTAGKFWANVKTDRNNEMEFRSPVAVASIRGTTLEFQYDPGAQVAFLGIDQGRGVMTGQRVSVNVGANRGVTVARDQRPSAPFAYTPDAPPAISDTAMAEALAAPPAALVPAPPVEVTPPAPISGAAAATPAAPSGGGGAITTAPAPAPAPTGIAPGTTPAPGAFVSGTFPSRVPSGLNCDDCFISVPFTGGFTFPFYGTTYTSAFVNSNGSITFNGGDDLCCIPNINELFRHQVGSNPNEGSLGPPRPTIAAFANDLYPPSVGTVDITQFANSFVLTFRNVPDFSGPGINTFRTWLFSNGQIRMEYNQTTLSGESRPQIGVSPGGHDARLNPVNFSSGSITGLTGAIFQSFNSTGTRSISHANISVPGFPTTTIVGNNNSLNAFDNAGKYRGSSPVSGNPFTLEVSSGSFALSYPTPTSPTFQQRGNSTFTPNGAPSTALSGTLSITSITPNLINPIPAGEFQFAAGTSIPVTITDRPPLPVTNLPGLPESSFTLIFTPNSVGGYDVSFIPSAPAIPASPSS